MAQIVLQARTDSSRLPAKSLLPIGGLPLAVLCAKRLSNVGIELVLATSAAASDDELAALARDHDVPVFRGDLANVALRFLTCLAHAADETVVVRATADNPVPDGTVVTGFLEDFATSGAPYLGAASYPGLGYGLGVEVMRLGALRRSYESQRNAALEEHVTSALGCGGAAIVPNPCRFALAEDSPRLTVDVLADYVVTARAFRSVPAPTQTGWREAAQAIIAERAADVSPTPDD